MIGIYIVTGFLKTLPFFSASVINADGEFGVCSCILLLAGPLLAIVCFSHFSENAAFIYCIDNGKIVN